jgi:tRNA dimethylallyltransferase
MDNLLIILGPTASGKTNLAVELADRYDGEIISADSRQIYKGMDIGTGKDLEEYYINNKKIPYHLIDILSPAKDYSVYQFKKDFKKSYKKIIANNHLPILCGGTGLYIESILLDYNMPKTIPDFKLRESLENDSVNNLIKKLKTIDKDKFDKEYHVSKRRLIRTIEILSDSKSNKVQMNLQGKSQFKETLILGINIQREKVLKLIKCRLDKRLKEGLIEEVEGLLKNGLSTERLHYFGLEYRFIGQYLSKDIDYSTMINKINIAINKFSKRQMTFFRRMEKRGINIKWVDSNDRAKIKSLIKPFLNK